MSTRVSPGTRALSYLNEMGRIPLLTPLEEVALAKRVKVGATALALLDDPDPLDPGAVAELAEQCDLLVTWATSPKRTRELCRQLVDEGLIARGKLIEANLRLVVSIAKGYLGRGLPMVDLIQEGNLGLIRAVDKFDYERGFKLSTYATWWIRQAITRGIENTSRLIRIPVHKALAVNRLARARYELVQELGREPVVTEVAERMEITVEQVRDLAGMALSPVSLDVPFAGDNTGTLGDVIEAKAETDPFDGDSILQRRRRVDEILRTLPEQEARVIELRLGFNDDRLRTLTDVGQALGINRDRVRQIERRALCRLCHPSRSNALRELFD